MRALFAPACRATSATDAPSKPRAAKSRAPAFRSELRVAWESWLRRGRRCGRRAFRRAAFVLIAPSLAPLAFLRAPSSNKLYTRLKQSVNGESTFEPIGEPEAYAPGAH